MALQPSLQAEHALQLLQAAADGELWNMTVTVEPDSESISHYGAGRQAGTVMHANHQHGSHAAMYVGQTDGGLVRKHCISKGKYKNPLYIDLSNNVDDFCY